MDTTLLLVLCVFVLLIAVALWVLFRLRAGLPDLTHRRAGLADRARGLSQEFSLLARRQPSNPGEPYASRLARANLDIRAGWQRAREIEASLRIVWQSPSRRPAWQLLLIVPLFLELVPRFWARLRLAWLERQAGQVESNLTAVRSQLEEVATLGTQEQSALRRLRSEVESLDEQLAGHRLAPALAAQRTQLSQINQNLADAAAQLGEEETLPEPAQVAAVYPVRTQAELELASIRKSLQAHETSQEKLRPRLEKLVQKLQGIEPLFAAEENRAPLPLLGARLDALRSTLTNLEEALTRGDYPAVEAGLVQGAALYKDLEDSLKKISTLRDRLAAAQQQNSAALAALREWSRQFQPPFVMDTANEQARLLQTKIQEQVQAASSEDPLELERLSQVQMDEIREAELGFERSLAIYERLEPQLVPEVIEGLQKRGEHLASRLKLRHASYQEKSRLAVLEEHLGHLAGSWQRVQQANLDLQSDLTGLGETLRQLENAWNNLERDEKHAFETLEQAKTHQERALTHLEDEAFGELPTLAQLEGTQWAHVARGLLERHAALLDRAGRGDSDFGALVVEADALQKEAAKLVKEYQLRLARVQAETTRLVAANNACADRLERVSQHPYLDFDERASGLLNDLRRWLGQAQVPAQSGFDRWNGLAEQGERLRQELEAVCRDLEGEFAAADQDRAWTEDMLVTAEEYLGSARQQQPPNSFNGELAAARNLLETARRKLGVLAAPRRKFLLDEFQAELVDVRQMISGARAHVDNVLK